MVKETPPRDSIENFWKDICGEKKLAIGLQAG